MPTPVSPPEREGPKHGHISQRGYRGARTSSAAPPRSWRLSGGFSLLEPAIALANALQPLMPLAAPHAERAGTSLDRNRKPGCRWTTRTPSAGPRRHRRQARGFSLLELVIALAIALIVLAALVRLMVASGAGFAQQDQSARLQENARVALTLLRHDLRMAGFVGCAGGRAATFDFIEHTTDPNGSAVITVRRADERAGVVGEPLAVTTAALSPGTLVADSRLQLALPRGNVPPGWAAGRTADLVVSDCRTATVLEAVAFEHIGPDEVELRLTAPTVIPHAVAAGAAVRTLLTATWFIDNTTGEIATNVVVPSLFRREAGAAAANIASGIEYLHLHYLTADETHAQPPADRTDLRAVEVALLARSVSNRAPGDRPTRTYGAADDGRAYALLDRTLVAGVADGDGGVPLPSLRGLRQVYSATVSLPNAPGWQ